MSLKKKFGARLKELHNANNKHNNLGIKEDSFNKYIRGDRFPKPEVLEKIKNYYNVPYSYLFGEYDNSDLDTSEISGKLCLSNKSINKLKKIRNEEDANNRNFMIFALNALIENINFLEMGKLLFIPDEMNKNINAEDIYSYYSDYINHCQGGISYRFDLNAVKNKQEYNKFLFNQKIFKLFDDISKSKECADLFIKYIDDERKMTADINIYENCYIPEEDDISSLKNDKELQEIIENENRLCELDNKKLIEERKKDLGI